MIEISSVGAVRADDENALLRLSARAGRYRVLAAPPDWVILRAESRRACMLSGEIRSPGTLCDVLTFVGQTGWRGEFMVEEKGASRSLYFDDGTVLAARSTVLNERLGEVLYRYGVLTRAQVAACSEAMVAGVTRFGEAAVSLGFVTRETLFAVMARQTEEIFYGAMRASEGMFYFLEGFEDADLSSRHRVSVAALIREGIRRMHETRYFRARIPSDRHIPVCVPGVARAHDPSGLLAAIDGSRSVADLCRVLGGGEFEISRALFQWVQAGYVVIRPPHLAPHAVVDVYNQAIALILRELDAMDQGDTVRTALGKYAKESPVYAVLFEDAGPADDGTLDAERIAAKIAPASDAEGRLAIWLYEYVSYAMFLARPHLQRIETARGTATPRLSARVTAILEHIAPPPPPPPAPLPFQNEVTPPLAEHVEKVR